MSDIDAGWGRVVEDLAEIDLAWQLVEQYRDILESAERHIVFVHLGIEDYEPVIVCILMALARQGGTLPDWRARQLRSWIARHHRHHRSDLVDRVASDPPRPARRLNADRSGTGT